MSTAVSIVTCQRPKGARFIDETVRTFECVGRVLEASDLRWILVDGDGADAAFSGWETTNFPGERSGIRVMMWRVFKKAVDARIDQLIFCEDDLLPCYNAFKYIRQFSVPNDIAFVDFHDLREANKRALSSPGIYRLPATQNYWGNQCMLFPRRTLEYLVTKDPMSVEGFHRPSGADNTLGIFIRESPWPEYLMHLPRLVEHTGIVSAAHAPRGGSFGMMESPGVMFDAMSLTVGNYGEGK